MVDGFSCILEFPKFSGGGLPDPSYKGNTSIKPSKSFFNNNSSQKAKKEPQESPPQLKQSTRNLSLGYTDIEKKIGGRWGKIFFVWFVIGLFETLTCAIAESVIAALSVPEHCLSLYFVCENQIQIFCAVWLRKMANLAVPFCYVTGRKALAPGGGGGGGAQPHWAPFKTLITLLPVTFSQLDPQLGVGWGKSFFLY